MACGPILPVEIEMHSSEVLLAIRPVVEVFSALSIRYFIGGSIASSLYGTARTTMDIDIIAEIRLGQVSAFRNALENAYYVDENMIVDAIRQGSSFNMIHLATLIKIDTFIHRRSAYQESIISRRVQDTLEKSDASPLFYFATPEDIILSKLQWYQQGGGVSERQWLDVAGVLKVQYAALDVEYLRIWASQLGVRELLEKAFLESGAPLPPHP